MNPILVDWHLVFCFPAPHRALRVHFSDTPSVRYLVERMVQGYGKYLEKMTISKT